MGVNLERKWIELSLWPTSNFYQINPWGQILVQCLLSEAHRDWSIFLWRTSPFANAQLFCIKFVRKSLANGQIAQLTYQETDPKWIQILGLHYLNFHCYFPIVNGWFNWVQQIKMFWEAWLPVSHQRHLPIAIQWRSMQRILWKVS